jgi:hypothetical protein
MDLLFLFMLMSHSDAGWVIGWLLCLLALAFMVGRVASAINAGKS